VRLPTRSLAGLRCIYQACNNLISLGTFEESHGGYSQPEVLPNLVSGVAAYVVCCV
jgi:hypothetical protein